MSGLLLALVTLSLSVSNAETIMVMPGDYVVRGCVKNGDSRFTPMPVQACGGKVYCLNASVECKFIMSEAVRDGADWRKVVKTENMAWVQMGATIFCKMEDNSCNVDLDTCANQSAKEAGCSLRKMPGAESFPTVPRGGVN